MLMQAQYELFEGREQHSLSRAAALDESMSGLSPLMQHIARNSSQQHVISNNRHFRGLLRNAKGTDIPIGGVRGTRSQWTSK